MKKKKNDDLQRWTLAETKEQIQHFYKMMSEFDYEKNGLQVTIDYLQYMIGEFIACKIKSEFMMSDLSIESLNVICKNNNMTQDTFLWIEGYEDIEDFMQDVGEIR